MCLTGIWQSVILSCRPRVAHEQDWRDDMAGFRQGTSPVESNGWRPGGVGGHGGGSHGQRQVHARDRRGESVGKPGRRDTRNDESALPAAATRRSSAPGRQGLNLFQRPLEPQSGCGRKSFTNLEVLHRDRQPPGGWTMAKHIARESKQDARVGRMGHDPTALGRFQFTQLHLRRVHRGVDEDNPARARNRFGQFGCQLMTDNRADSGQLHLLNRRGHFGSDSVVGAKLVAVAYHEHAAVGFRH